MYKYVFTGPGSVHIKNPAGIKYSDVKITSNITPDKAEVHYEYPNGLIVDTVTYSDRFEYVTNKRLVVLNDFSIGFED